MLAASWLALPADVALAAMLIRRIRDLVGNLTGLAAWALLEGSKGQRIELQRGIDVVR